MSPHPETGIDRAFPPVSRTLRLGLCPDPAPPPHAPLRPPRPPRPLIQCWGSVRFENVPPAARPTNIEYGVRGGASEGVEATSLKSEVQSWTSEV